MSEPIELSFDEAAKLLPEGDTVHTFRNPRLGMMLGADWNREDVLKAMRESDVIQVTGPAAQSMRHGIAINHGGGILFIEAANYEAARAAISKAEA